MAHTTVRLDDETKRELDRIQGLLQAELGRRFTLNETIARMVRLAQRRADLLVSDVAEPWSPPPKEWFDEIFGDLPDPGIETDSSNLDELLYGDDDA